MRMSARQRKPPRSRHSGASDIMAQKREQGAYPPALALKLRWCRTHATRGGWARRPLRARMRGRSRRAIGWTRSVPSSYSRR